MFTGSRHCPGCGAQAERAEVQTTDARQCPRCRINLEAVAVGTISLRECARCGGLWMDAAAFERICADREQQAAVLGAPLAKLANAAGSKEDSGHVRYVPCPECAQLMNRVNFARCSGVVVDVCKGHGTWFDRDELQRIIEFVRAGGLSVSRAREVEQLAEERRRLRQQQLAATDTDSLLGLRDETHQSSASAAARELLKILID